MSINTGSEYRALHDEYTKNYGKWLQLRYQARHSGFFGYITELYPAPMCKNTGLIPVKFIHIGGEAGRADVLANKLDGGVVTTYVLSREVWGNATSFPESGKVTSIQADEILDRCLVEKTRFIHCCGFSEIYGTGKLSIYRGHDADGYWAKQFKVGLFLAACASSLTTDFLGKAAGLQLIFSTEHYDLGPMGLIINKLQELISRYELGTYFRLPNMLNPNSFETLGTLIWSPSYTMMVSAATWDEIKQEIVVWD